MTDLPPTPDLDADDALLEELRALAAEVDPTPRARPRRGARELHAGARSTPSSRASSTTRYSTRSALAAVRSADEARLLTFETPVD